MTARLEALVAEGALSRDLQQARAAAVLDRVAWGLTGPSSRGFLGLLGKPRTIRGAYLVGQVGRGKTMLMDLFYDVVEPLEKRRAHFHEFMDDVHAAITEFRKSPKGKDEDADPVVAAVLAVLGDTRLLCLDEFQVQDIANAMLLGRLFGRLWDNGVTVVATSNTPPDELYENGLNRGLVLPFIARLKEESELVPLDGPLDYRREKFEGAKVFVFGSDAAAKDALDRLWLKITGGVAGEPAGVPSLGRTIKVPRAAMGAARFPFADLCDTPLGARDYLRIAHAYDTLMIDAVPQFSRINSNAAKRFILLVDTLYDRGVKLAASFAVPIEALGQDDRTAREFERTASRLTEMQSAAYLEAPHKAEPTPAG